MSSTPSTAINFEKLRLFVRVAEMGSLTRVAIANDLMQSAISRQIAALERQCGSRLFQRTGRGVTLSAFGEQFLPRAVELLADADRLASDMRSNAGVPTGEVRLGLVPSLARPLVNMLYCRLRDRYPGIRLRCFDTSSGLIDEGLASGKLDIGMPFRYARVPSEEQPLAKVGTYLVGPPGDRLTGNETVDFKALDGLPLVLPGIPNGLCVTLDRLGKRHHVRLVVAMEVESLTMQKDLAAAGTAHTVLSGNAVLHEVKAGMLQASRIVNPGIDRIISLVTTTHHPLSFAAREVARLMRNIGEELAGNGVWQPLPD